MTVGLPSHDAVQAALDEMLHAFVAAEGLEAEVLTERPFGKFSQYKIDTAVEFASTGAYPPLAVEFETGAKVNTRIVAEIRERFARYRARGYDPIIAAAGFVLAGGGDETLLDVAAEFDAGVLEVSSRGGELRFQPRRGMDDGAPGRLASFLSSEE